MDIEWIVCDICGVCVDQDSFYVRGLDDGTAIEICEACHKADGGD